MKYALHSLHSAGGRFLAEIQNPKKDAPEELKEGVNLVLGIGAWAGTAAGVGGIIITGVMMAVSMKRGEGSEHMSRLGMVLGGCILVSAAGPIVNFFF
ncbi:hypothetical protein [Streptomyces olivaceus]|uniref:hypothetical protein n=1 Tax=Streptomyces olivaceus TaxID=47716 RepID=UPI00405618CF